MKLLSRLFFLLVAGLFAAPGFAGEYSLLPERENEQNRKVKVADIAEEPERLQALREALQPYLTEAPEFGFRWVNHANYLAMTGRRLDSEIWQLMQEKLEMKGGFYVSRNPIDSYGYGVYLQIIQFPKKFFLLNTTAMGIDYVNQGPGPVLVHLGYANEQMVESMSYLNRSPEEMDKLNLFSSDLKKLGIPGTIYNFNGTWMHIETPNRGIQVISPEEFLKAQNSNPKIQKLLQSPRLQTALNWMKNPSLSILCRNFHSAP